VRCALEQRRLAEERRRLGLRPEAAPSGMVPRRLCDSRATLRRAAEALEAAAMMELEVLLHAGNASFHTGCTPRRRPEPTRAQGRQPMFRSTPVSRGRCVKSLWRPPCLVLQDPQDPTRPAATDVFEERGDAVISMPGLQGVLQASAMLK
jgi:hypothetical protein